jgi:hypothetical protein
MSHAFLAHLGAILEVIDNDIQHVLVRVLHSDYEHINDTFVTH